MLKFFKRGFVFTKENPKILYSLFLIILIPFAIFYNTSFSMRAFQKNIDFALQSNALLAESILGNFISELVLKPEILAEKIKKVSNENPEINKIWIAVSEGEKFKIIASKNKEEIGIEIKGRVVNLAWSENQALAYQSSENGKRFWEVVKPIQDAEGKKIGIIGIAISLSQTDDLVRKTVFKSYLIATIAIILALFLIIHHTQLFGYVTLSKQLQKLDKMKDDFIRMAIHEIQSPIVNLRNYTQALKEEMGDRLSDIQREYVSRIVTSATRLTSLISDMLEVSRIEQGRTSLVAEKVSPRETIKEVVAELRQKAEDKGLKIVFEDAPDIFFISANSNRLKETFYNLIDNAIKYTIKGKVGVKIKIDQSRRKCYISVEDTGLGISAEAQKQLFEKFYRVKTKETADISGTGLGLWISKALTEKMGGEIFIESIEGTGSRFTISFPLIKS
ncbi:hypothetical protein KJ636_00355 [Patescibacteria group bacterium]|nr:hypothetical protein [Patescibacteria group bacterium]MBU4481369.1 hypothetical protein [Patescibacteria group bacterium]